MDESVIVLGTGVVSLGVIRDLVDDGVKVTHISSKPDDIALRSRLPSERVLLRENQQSTDELLQVLLDPARDWDGACLIPTIDPMVVFVSKNLARLKTRFTTPVIEWAKLQRVVDKGMLYAAADAAGIPVPRVHLVTTLEDACEWAHTAVFPVIVKPRQTPEFFKIFRVKVLEAHDEFELRAKLRPVVEHGLEVMVSEVIPGDVGALYSYRAYVDRHGEIAADMCSQKVRTHPTEYGVGRIHRTVPMPPSVREQGCRLLKSLDFRGFASVEFKRDARDGQLKLMEINARPALSQRLFRAAGINFAHLTVMDLNNHPLPKDPQYEPDVYVIHNTDELYYLRSYLRRGWSGIREFIAPYRQRRKVFMIPLWRDPKPLLYQLGRMTRKSLRRLAKGTKTHGV